MADKNAPRYGPGMPAYMHLELFGLLVRDAFGELPYLVGSCLDQKDGWRDVDVRLILDDDRYQEMFGNRSGWNGRLNRKWAAICMAWSALGQTMTGLPIDFQIQARADANEKFPGARQALGIPYTVRIEED